MKTLVVYYSRTGITKKVGEMIAEQLACDLEPIEEDKDRMGAKGFLLSCYEALCKKIPPIRTTGRDPAAYDLVILGTPVWAGKMASPIRAYLEEKEDFLPAAAFFSTSGGSGGFKVMQEMQSFCEHEAVARLELKDKDVKSGSNFDEIKKFTESLRAEQGS